MRRHIKPHAAIATPQLRKSIEDKRAERLAVHPPYNRYSGRNTIMRSMMIEAESYLNRNS